jgi:hypothetical protein
MTMLGFCLILSNNAFAQLKDNIELNFFGAGSVYTANNYEISFPQSTTPIPGRLRFENKVRGGVRLGVYTRGHWGQEFYYSFEPNNAQMTQNGAGARNVNLKMGIHNYGVNALYYFQRIEEHAIRPFLSAGVGGAFYDLSASTTASARDPQRINLPDLDNSNELTFNYGIGFKTRSSGPIGVRADFRGFISRSPSFGLARQSDDPTATVLPATGALHNGEFSIGFIVYFGNAGR